MGSDRDFLNRGRGTPLPTVEVRPPSPHDPSNTSMVPNAISEIRTGFGSVMQGRVSLAMLNLLLLGMVGFYLWTRRAQGGG